MFQPEDTLSSNFRLEGDGKIRGSSENSSSFGTYLPKQRRFSWDLQALRIDPQLAAWVAEEASLWDDWSDAASQDSQPYVLKDKHTLSGWLGRYPEIGKALEAAGITLDLTGNTVLDVGGSGIDLVYWLDEAPARIDQVEVSSKSQALCLKKLTDLNVLNKVPVFFHTVPAERLPFDDNTYDFVFSRSTLHHCMRPDVLDEVFRVIKPGGKLLFSESYLSDFLYLVMRFDRRIRRRDRGTDDPLRPCHLRYCEEQYAASGTVFRKSVFNSLPVVPKGSPGAGTGMSVCFAGQKAR